MSPEPLALSRHFTNFFYFVKHPIKANTDLEMFSRRKNNGIKKSNRNINPYINNSLHTYLTVQCKIWESN